MPRSYIINRENYIAIIVIVTVRSFLLKIVNTGNLEVECLITWNDNEDSVVINYCESWTCLSQNKYQMTDTDYFVCVCVWLSVCYI